MIWGCSPDHQRISRSSISAQISHYQDPDQSHADDVGPLLPTALIRARRTKVGASTRSWSAHQSITKAKNAGHLGSANSAAGHGFPKALKP